MDSEVKNQEAWMPAEFREMMARFAEQRALEDDHDESDSSHEEPATDVVGQMRANKMKAAPTDPEEEAVKVTPNSTDEVSPESMFPATGAMKSKIVSSGVIAGDAADAGPIPLAFDAVTVNVYAVPLVSPVTVVLVAEAPAETGVPAVDPTYGVTV